MEHLLLKAFKRVKHCRPDSNKSYRTNKLRRYSQGLCKAESLTTLNESLGYTLTGAEAPRAKLRAIAARGVSLATAVQLEDLFSNAGLPANNINYRFSSTMRFWWNAQHPTEPQIGENSDITPEQWEDLGYIRIAGKTRPLRDAVRDRKGDWILKGDAVTTLWGITGETAPVSTPCIDKRLRALLPAGTVFSQASYPVPLDLCTATYGINLDALEYQSGVWTRPDVSRAFNIDRLGNYHSSRKLLRSLQPWQPQSIRIGLEIELECLEGKRNSPTAVAVAKYLNKVVHPRYTLVERDNSVRNGFELVTSPATIQFHKAAMLTLAQAGVGKGDRTNPLLRCAPESHKAGVHIHVDRRSVTNWPALSALFNTADYVDGRNPGNPFRSIMFGREANRYCPPYAWLWGADYEHQHGKYRPINDDHAATYEARVFSSSNDPLVLLGHIEVMHAAVAMTNNIIGTPRHRLTAKAFAMYIVANKATYPRAAPRAAKYLENLSE